MSITLNRRTLLAASAVALAAPQLLCTRPALGRTEGAAPAGAPARLFAPGRES